jgi:hypothetical protein
MTDDLKIDYELLEQTTTKVCHLCERLKPYAEFGDHPLARDGKQTHCKECKRVYGRLNYQWKSGKITEGQFRAALVEYQVSMMDRDS